MRNMPSSMMSFHATDQPPAPPRLGRRLAALVLGMAALTDTSLCLAQSGPIPTTEEHTTMTNEQTLSAKQQAIAPIAAFAATGDMARLDNALNQGLDAKLSV